MPEVPPNKTASSKPGSLPGFLPAFLGAIMRPPTASRGRFILAMCVALAADCLFWWLGEGVPVVADFVVAFLITLCLGGFSVELLGAFIAEATPGVGLIPFWSVAVPIIWARASAMRKAPPPAPGR